MVWQVWLSRCLFLVVMLFSVGLLMLSRFSIFCLLWVSVVKVCCFFFEVLFCNVIMFCIFRYCLILLKGMIGMVIIRKFCVILFCLLGKIFLLGMLIILMVMLCGIGMLLFLSLLGVLENWMIIGQLLGLVNRFWVRCLGSLGIFSVLIIVLCCLVCVLWMLWWCLLKVLMLVVCIILIILLICLFLLGCLILMFGVYLM